MSSLEDNYEVDDTTLDLASLLCESDEKLLITDLSSEPGGLYSDAEAEQSGFISGYETYHRGLAIQVLGRKESSLETIETFDYSLVKAWYDTGEKKFFFHKDFLDQMGQNKIIVKNEKTEERVSNFLRRLPSSPFTIERDKNFEQRQSYRHHTPPVPSLHEF